MATWESDQRPLASPGRPVPRFKTVRRGFDPDEVMGYLAALRNQFEHELRQAKLQSESQKDAQGVGPDVADLVRTFDHVERLRREAAERMVAEAKAEAERIRVDTQFETESARADARRTLRDAQMEADGILSELEARREAVLSGLRAIREDILGAASGLEATIEWGVNRRVRGRERGGGGPAPAPGP